MNEILNIYQYLNIVNEVNERDILVQFLHKKWSFSLRISLVNVAKSPGNCGFDHIYWRNP